MCIHAILYTMGSSLNLTAVDICLQHKWFLDPPIDLKMKNGLRGRIKRIPKRIRIIASTLSLPFCVVGRNSYPILYQNQKQVTMSVMIFASPHF